MSGSQSTAGVIPDILLEVRPAATSGDLAPRALIPEDFRSRAGEIADSIAEVADDFRSRLGKVLDRRDATALRVDSVEIEFGITVQAEAGVVIAKATAGSTFTARLVLQASEVHRQ